MDSTRLAQIRKEFYVSTRKRVETIIGRESPDLIRYRQKYESELIRLKCSAVNKKQFMSRLKQANIILVGDFHVQKQSSRGLLRLLRKVNTRFVLCVECLTTADQQYIDQYLSGELAEKDFLIRVGWKQKWSFPWENYRPLFKWAQAHNGLVFGINAESGLKSLSARDKYSAMQIKRIRSRHRESQIFVQFGDLHLASAHLPRQIKKQLPKDNLCTIYQSPEIIYFRIMEEQKEQSTDVVKLSEDQWALNVLPPWVKWQDFLLYLESNENSRGGSADKKIKKSDFDLTDNVSHSVALLSDSFGFKTNTASLSVYSSMDESFFDQIDTLSINVRKRILENVQEGQSFYIPELQIAYLSRLSVNHVSKIAAQYIYFVQKGFTKTLSDPRKDFLKMIWLEMVTYLCSKIANPKRKSDTLQDIRSALQKEQFDDRGKEALMLSLNQKLSELHFISSKKIRNISAFQTKVLNKRSYVIASQILGGIMGEKFYSAIIKKHLKMPLDKKVIFKDLQSAHFSEVYFETLEQIESWPVSFKSKFDKL